MKKKTSVNIFLIFQILKFKYTFIWKKHMQCSFIKMYLFSKDFSNLKWWFRAIVKSGKLRLMFTNFLLYRF